MHVAKRVGANDCFCACACTVDNDGVSGCVAQMNIRLTFKHPVAVLCEAAWCVLGDTSKFCLDHDEVVIVGKLALDVRFNFYLVSGSVKALVILKVTEQRRIEAGPLRAGQTGTCLGKQFGILTVKWGFSQG